MARKQTPPENSKSKSKQAEWLRSFSKSMARSTIKVASEIMPVSTSSVSSFVRTQKDLKVTVKRSVKVAQTTERKRTSRAAQTVFRNALEDLKTGKFNMEKVSDDLYSDYDAFIDDKFEYDPDSDADAELSAEELALQGDRGIAQSVVASSSAQINALQQVGINIANSQISSAKALAISLQDTILKESSILSYTLTQTNHKLEAINRNLMSLVEYQSEATTPMHESTMEYQQKMTEMISTLGKMFTSYEESRDGTWRPASKGYHIGSGFDADEYIENVKKNFSNSSIGLSLQMMKAMTGLDAMENGDWKKHPIKLAMEQFVIPGLIPKKLKSSLGGFDKNLKTYMQELLYQVGDLSTGGSNEVLRMIGQVFGTPRDRNLSRIDLSNYSKEPMPWNGVAQKALVETLPELISSIDAKLPDMTGNARENQRYMDYSEGRFKTRKEIQDTFQTRADNEILINLSTPIEKISAAIDTLSDLTEEEKATRKSKLNSVINRRISSTDGKATAWDKSETIEALQGISDTDFKKFILDLEKGLASYQSGMKDFYHDIATSDLSVFRNIVNSSQGHEKNADAILAKSSNRDFFSQSESISDTITVVKKILENAGRSTNSKILKDAKFLVDLSTSVRIDKLTGQDPVDDANIVQRVIAKVDAEEIGTTAKGFVGKIKQKIFPNAGNGNSPIDRATSSIGKIDNELFKRVYGYERTQRQDRTQDRGTPPTPGPSGNSGSSNGNSPSGGSTDEGSSDSGEEPPSPEPPSPKRSSRVTNPGSSSNIKPKSSRQPDIIGGLAGRFTNANTVIPLGPGSSQIQDQIDKDHSFGGVKPSSKPIAASTNMTKRLGLNAGSSMENSGLPETIRNEAYSGIEAAKQRTLINNIATSDASQALNRSPARIDQNLDMVQGEIKGLANADAPTTTEQALVQNANTNKTFMLAVLNSFQNLNGHLFGSNGMLSKILNSDWLQDGVEKLNNKLFNEKDGLFKDQIAKVKEGAKWLGGAVKDELTNGYDFIYDNTMKELFGEDYRNNENWQKYARWADIKGNAARKKEEKERLALSASESEKEETQEQTATKKSSRLALPAHVDNASSNTPTNNKDEDSTDPNVPVARTYRERVTGLLALPPHIEDKNTDTDRVYVPKSPKLHSDGSVSPERGLVPVSTSNTKAIQQALVENSVGKSLVSAQKIEESAEELNEALYGDPNIPNNKKYEGFFAKFKKILPKAIAGGIAGAGVGLLNWGHAGLLGSMFLPGGPIGGAIAGAGLTILSQTEAFKSVLFGKMNQDGEREGGIINKKMRESFKKALPAIVGGATLGAIRRIIFGPGMLLGGTPVGMVLNTLLPGGVLGGAFLGLGISVLKHSETVKDLFFGKKGEDGKRQGSMLSSGFNKVSAAIKGAIPMLGKGAAGAGIGVLTGVTLSHMGWLPAMFSVGGPVGAGMVGLGLGLASTSKRFNEYIFGSEELDKDGNPTGKRRKDGLLARLRNIVKVNVVDPIASTAKNKIADFIEWTKMKIEYPFRLVFGPILDSVITIKDNVVDFVKDRFSDLTDGIGAMFKKVLHVMFSPFTKVLGKMASGITSAISTSLKLTLLPVTGALQIGKIATMGTRRKEYLQFYKNYYQNLPGALREKWEAQEEETGKKRGIFGKASDVLSGIFEQDTDIRDSARAGWNQRMALEGEDHLKWREVPKEKRDLREQIKQRKTEAKNWRHIDKWREEYANKTLGGKEVVLQEAEIERIRKKLGKYGVDAEDLQDSDAIMDLLYRRGEWRKRRKDRLGSSIDPLAQEIVVNETEEQKQAREATARYQERIANILESINDKFFNLAGNEAAKKHSANEEEVQRKRMKRVRRRAKSAGIDLSRYHSDVIGSMSVADLPRKAYDDFRESEEYETGDWEGWLAKHANDYEDVLDWGIEDTPGPGERKKSKRSGKKRSRPQSEPDTSPKKTSRQERKKLSLERDLLSDEDGKLFADGIEFANIHTPVTGKSTISSKQLERARKVDAYKDLSTEEFLKTFVGPDYKEELTRAFTQTMSETPLEDMSTSLRELVRLIGINNIQNEDIANASYANAEVNTGGKLTREDFRQSKGKVTEKDYDQYNVTEEEQGQIQKKTIGGLFKNFFTFRAKSEKRKQREEREAKESEEARGLSLASARNEDQEYDENGNPIDKSNEEESKPKGILGKLASGAKGIFGGAVGLLGGIAGKLFNFGPKGGIAGKLFSGLKLYALASGVLGLIDAIRPGTSDQIVTKVDEVSKRIPDIVDNHVVPFIGGIFTNVLDKTKSMIDNIPEFYKNYISPLIDTVSHIITVYGPAAIERTADVMVSLAPSIAKAAVEVIPAIIGSLGSAVWEATIGNWLGNKPKTEVVKTAEEAATEGFVAPTETDKTNAFIKAGGTVKNEGYIAEDGTSVAVDKNGNYITTGDRTAYNEQTGEFEGVTNTGATSAIAHGGRNALVSMLRSGTKSAGGNLLRGAGRAMGTVFGGITGAAIPFVPALGTAAVGGKVGRGLGGLVARPFEALGNRIPADSMLGRLLGKTGATAARETAETATKTAAEKVTEFIIRNAGEEGMEHLTSTYGAEFIENLLKKAGGNADDLIAVLGSYGGNINRGVQYASKMTGETLTQKAAQAGVDAAAKGATRGAAQAGEEIAERGVRAAAEGAGAASGQKGLLASTFTKLKNGIKGLLTNPTLAKFLDKFKSKFPGIAGLPSKIAKYFDDILEKMLSKIAKLSDTAVGKWLNKILKKLGKGTIGSVPLITVLFAAYDGVTGAFEAANLFGIPEDSVDWIMRIISSLMKLLLGLSIPGAVIDICLEIGGSLLGIDFKKNFASMVYGFFAGEEKKTQLTASQDQLAIEAQLYNQANHTNLDVNAYNDLKNKSAMGKLWANAKDLWGHITGNEDLYKPDYSQYEAQAKAYQAQGKTADDIKNQTVAALNTTSTTTTSTTTTVASTSQVPIGFGPATAGNKIFAQNDPRWANKPIGVMPNGETATMKTGGCGPTALAIAANTALGRGPVTPDKVGAMAAQSGYISQGGANARLFTEGAARLGLSPHPVLSRQDMVAALASGNPVVMSGVGNQNRTPFTKVGHIVTAKGLDNAGRVSVQDPLDGKTKKYELNDLSRGVTAGWMYTNARDPHGRLGQGLGSKRSVGYGPAVVTITDVKNLLEGKKLNNRYTPIADPNNLKKFSEYDADNILDVARIIIEKDLKFPQNPNEYAVTKSILLAKLTEIAKGKFKYNSPLRGVDRYVDDTVSQAMIAKAIAYMNVLNGGINNRKLAEDMFINTRDGIDYRSLWDANYLPTAPTNLIAWAEYLVSKNTPVVGDAKNVTYAQLRKKLLALSEANTMAKAVEVMPKYGNTSSLMDVNGLMVPMIVNPALNTLPEDTILTTVAADTAKRAKELVAQLDEINKNGPADAPDSPFTAMLKNITQTTQRQVLLQLENNLPKNLLEQGKLEEYPRINGFPWFDPNNEHWADLKISDENSIRELGPRAKEVLTLSSILSAATGKTMTPEFVLKYLMPYLEMKQVVGDIPKSDSVILSSSGKKSFLLGRIFKDTNPIWKLPIMQNEKVKKRFAPTTVNVTTQGTDQIRHDLTKKIPYFVQGPQFDGSMFGGTEIPSRTSASNYKTKGTAITTFLDEKTGALHFVDSTKSTPMYTDKKNLFETKVRGNVLPFYGGSAFKLVYQGNTPLETTIDSNPTGINQHDVIAEDHEDNSIWGVIRRFLSGMAAVGNEMMAARLTGEKYTEQLDENGKVLGKGPVPLGYGETPISKGVKMIADKLNTGKAVKKTEKSKTPTPSTGVPKNPLEAAMKTAVDLTQGVVQQAQDKRAQEDLNGTADSSGSTDTGATTGATSAVGKFVDPLARFLQNTSIIMGSVADARLSGISYEEARSKYGEFNMQDDPTSLSYGSSAGDVGFADSPFKGSTSSKKFIDAIIPGAMKTWNKYKVLPSITLAQAALESGWGKSAYGNNFFGIKANDAWIKRGGKWQWLRTSEYDSKTGKRYSTRAKFRVYDTPDAGIEDHGLFLYENGRYRRNGFFDSTNYADAARALKRAGYATTPDYAESLINMIRQKNFSYYDDPKNEQQIKSQYKILYEGEKELVEKTQQAAIDLTNNITKALGVPLVGYGDESALGYGDTSTTTPSPFYKALDQIVGTVKSSTEAAKAEKEAAQMAATSAEAIQSGAASDATTPPSDGFTLSGAGGEMQKLAQTMSAMSGFTEAMNLAWREGGTVDAYEEAKLKVFNGSNFDPITGAFTTTPTNTLATSTEGSTTSGSSVPSTYSDTNRNGGKATKGPVGWLFNSLSSNTRITSPFGPRGKVNGVPGASSYHKGVDIGGNPSGTPIYSVSNGTVVTSKFGSGYGNYVVIKDSKGYSYYYAHMSKRAVNSGDKVQQGSLIGYVGSTGNSSGPHIHFEIRNPSGTAINPVSFTDWVDKPLGYGASFMNSPEITAKTSAMNVGLDYTIAQTAKQVDKELAEKETTRTSQAKTQRLDGTGGEDSTLVATLKDDNIVDRLDSIISVMSGWRDEAKAAKTPSSGMHSVNIDNRKTVVQGGKQIAPQPAATTKSTTNATLRQIHQMVSQI